MTIPTRILRAMATDYDPHPRTLTPRQQQMLERIQIIGLKIFAAFGPQNITFRQFAEALDISPRVLKHYYVDLDALVGDLIRTHLAALSAELGKIAENADNRAAKLRQAYYNFTHTALGALTDAHLLTTRDTELLPDDERLPIEATTTAIGQIIAGPKSAETMRLLDTADLTLSRIEQLLANNAANPANNAGARQATTIRAPQTVAAELTSTSAPEKLKMAA